MQVSLTAEKAGTVAYCFLFRTDRICSMHVRRGGRKELDTVHYKSAGTIYTGVRRTKRGFKGKQMAE